MNPNIELHSVDRPFPAYKGDEPYIFVCYAHENTDIVYPELRWLQDQKLNIWYDEGISGGKVWRAEIADSIQAASKILYYVSKASLESAHCNREIDYALTRDLDVIPVFLDNTKLTPELELALNRIQALHRADDERYQQRLLDALGQESEVPAHRHLEAHSQLRPSKAPMVRVALELAGWEDWKEFHGRSIVFSPNGKTVVYVARDDAGMSVLRSRSLDRLETVELSGTQGAEDPFFSPDGKWVGFFQGKLMKRVSPGSGNPPSIITTLNSDNWGAAWGSDDRIYYAESYTGLKSVAVSGGNTQVLSEPDTLTSEISHRQPFLIPGSRILLYSIAIARGQGPSQTWALNLDTDVRRYLFVGMVPS
jgi:hypothetical protein